MKLFLLFSLVFICIGLLPDLATIKLIDVYIANSQDGKEKLRFTNGIANIGQGPLYIHSARVLTPNEAAPKSKATQYIFDANGNKIGEHVVGVFVFHPQHNVILIN